MCRGRNFGLAAMASALAVCTACSETNRHRVLSFFLDGVPPPGARVVADTNARVPTPGGPADTGQRAVPQKLFAHTPYRENRCQGCHDADSGQLTRPLSEGLCLTCHAEVVGTRFVHGPAAVNDCTACHHYHASAFPKLLLVESTATCLNCHDRDDLSVDDHHAGIDQRTCIECHDPHGGANRFFVKGGGP